MSPEEIESTYGARETMEYDVVMVGAGPAGLSTAIRLKQLAAKKGCELNVCVLEKGSEPGAHILSGAVMDPTAIAELFPNWQELGAPLNQPVTRDDVLLLSETSHRRTPDALVPRNFHNEGCYVISLGAVTKWLAEQAEGLGVEIFRKPSNNDAGQRGMERSEELNVVQRACSRASARRNHRRSEREEGAGTAR